LQRRSIYLFWLLLFSAVLLSACASLTEYRRKNLYEARVSRFSHDLRWGDYEKAATYIKMRDKQPKTLDLDYLKQIRITRYDLISEKPLASDEKVPTEIQSVYAVDFYDSSNNIVQTFRYQQVWWFDETLDNWFLDTNLPDFK